MYAGVLAIFVFIALGQFYGLRVGKDENKQEPHVCEHFELEVLYWQRLKEYHSGEINEKQYRDSIYNDIQKHFIFKK